MDCQTQQVKAIRAVARFSYIRCFSLRALPESFFCFSNSPLRVSLLAPFAHAYYGGGRLIDVPWLRAYRLSLGRKLLNADEAFQSWA